MKSLRILFEYLLFPFLFFGRHRRVFTEKPLHTLMGAISIALATPSVSIAKSGGDYRDFTLREQIVDYGNMVTIGNTILVVPQNTTDCSQYRDGSYYSDTTGTNADYTLCPYYADGEHPSTSAEAVEGEGTNQIPPGSHLLWAGLYWQSIVKNEDQDQIQNQVIRIKNGDDPYEEVHYTTLDYKEDAGREGYTSYSAFADVTQILKDHGWLTGTFTVADIPTETHNIPGLGQYGAWTLVLVYGNPQEKMRVFSIFDGWKKIEGFADPEDAEVEIEIEGFYTPKRYPIRSAVSVFTAEGDRRISGDYLEIQNANEEDRFDKLTYTTDQTFDSSIHPDIPRTPDPLNNQGVDIQTFEVGGDSAEQSKLTTGQTSITFKFTTETDGDDQDTTYFPSMIAFNTEVYTPDICYDYAYKQNGRYFTEENNGTQDPKIIGSLFSDAPVEVSLYLKNRKDSDLVLSDLLLHIDDINTSQASYIDGSAEIILPGDTARQEASVASSAPSYIHGVDIGDLGGKEYFYFYYQLDPSSDKLDMPINATIDYNMTITTPDGQVFSFPARGQKINSQIPLCVSGDYRYSPDYGAFNVEQNAAGGKYNIFTQVARRIENFKVKYYDKNDVYSERNISTLVAIELIDAGGYHDAQVSCDEPDSALTPRIWITLNFENNVSETDFNKAVIQAAMDENNISDRIIGTTPLGEEMDEPEDFFSVIRRNTAFRISYDVMGDGESPLIDKNVNQYGEVEYTILNWRTEWEGENCVVDMDGNPNNEDKVASYCNDTGNNPNELIACMECVYGKDVKYICSRDNFAIRPEALKVSFSDDNTSTVNEDFANNIDKAGNGGSPVNLVAGYPYRIDINATAHDDSDPVKGYVQLFGPYPDRRAWMQWTPRIISEAEAAVNCNAPSDRNMTFSMVDGTNTNANPINTWADRHDSLSDVGEYEFRIVDREWTKYDWDPNYLGHHSGDYFYDKNTPDCVVDSDGVPADLGSRVGCDTSSVHQNNSTGTDYLVMSIRSYPHHFDLASIQPTIGPAGHSFVYMNTPPLTNDEDKSMSYNLDGVFRAVGYDGNATTNFVTGCYAQDVNVTLYFSSDNNDSNLSYSLQDLNSTGDRIFPTGGTDDFFRVLGRIDLASGKGGFDQNESYFVKDMNGSVNMKMRLNFERHYNKPLPPKKMTFFDLNASLKTQPSPLYAEGKNDHKVAGGRALDNNVSFLYGRMRPSKFYYDDVVGPSIVTPISVLVYSNDPTVMDPATFEMTGEYEWYLNTAHTTADGNLALVVSSDGNVSGYDESPNDGVYENVTVGDDNKAHPLTVDVNLTGTDLWLIYNPSADEEPVPFYRVRFIGTSGWAGQGKTGNVVEINASRFRNRRLNW